MAGTFTPRKFFPGFELDYVGPGAKLAWNGDQVLATAIEASRRAINDVSKMAAEIAREEHPWRNITGQTEASVFWAPAIIEEAPLRVWGEWGVEDRPRILHEADEFGEMLPVLDELGNHVHEDVTTKDVALFLEFGTIHAQPYPWLYPVWDQTKYLLPELVSHHYREIARSGAPTAIRSPLGRFMPHDFFGRSSGL